MTQRIAIIGGGVIGLSLAWELAQRGVDVDLYERDRIGAGTSWSASGILPPANFQTATDPLDALRGLSHQRYPVWAAELARVSGIDVGLRASGGWYLADSPGERAALAGMHSYWTNLQIACESVPLKEVARREPALAEWANHATAAAAWWVDDEYQIRPPRLIKALTRACRDAGVGLAERCPISDLTRHDSVVNATVNGRPIAADKIVICAGSWAGQIAHQLGLQSSLIPVRGQIVSLKTDRPVLRGIVNFGNRYIVARNDGHTLVGSCEEEVGFEFGTTDVMLHALHEFAVQKVPRLANAPRVGQWSGLRPMTLDGFPMIGRVPHTSNLFMAAGHYRSGIHLAPATSVCVADLMLGCSPPVDLDPFRIALHE
jgi:glycine oxidase